MSRMASEKGRRIWLSDFEWIKIAESHVIRVNYFILTISEYDVSIQVAVWPQ